MSHIDEEKELADYQSEILTKARETMSEEDVAYVEEDLRSLAHKRLLFLESLRK